MPSIKCAIVFEERLLYQCNSTIIAIYKYLFLYKSGSILSEITFMSNCNVFYSFWNVLKIPIWPLECLLFPPTYLIWFFKNVELIKIKIYVSPQMLVYHISKRWNECQNIVKYCQNVWEVNYEYALLNRSL